MSFTVKPMSVKSSDGIHDLKGKLYIPDGEIKALFHIVHGMTEYIGRYDHVMSMVAENGYLCFGYDNLGHGNTANDDSELGFIAEKDGWKLLVDDVFVFGNAVKELYPGKPLYLMGHSMGSFIVRLAAEKYGKNYDKLIICGTGGKNPLAGAGLLLTSVIKAVKGKKHISNLCINMAFGSYPKRFTYPSKVNWLSNDTEVIKNYESDKFCTFKFTVSAMYDLIKLNAMCNRKAWYKNMRKDLPILIISGADDPVGDYSKGVLQVYGDLKKAGADVKVKIYENCRHEIHNDTCRQEVLNNILTFLRG